MIFTIDLDLPKRILGCRRARNIYMRRSASRLGFHFRWQCSRGCKTCRAIEKKFDDERRRGYDLKRPARTRKVLWTAKGKQKAERWKKVR